MGLDRPGDAAGRVFPAAAFGVVEGFAVIVEVFLGPGGSQLPFVRPFDAIPAVAAIGLRKVYPFLLGNRGTFGHWCGELFCKAALRLGRGF